MNEKNLVYLKIVYLWGLALVLFSVVYDLHANARALLMLIAFTPILIGHIKVLIESSAWKAKKLFFILSLFWGIKIVSLGINEGLYFFLDKGMLILDWLDLFLLFVIAFMVSLSFLINIPFFYERTKSKVTVFLGMLGLLLSVWTAVMVGLSLIDLCWTHSSLITKIR